MTYRAFIRQEWRGEVRLFLMDDILRQCLTDAGTWTPLPDEAVSPDDNIGLRLPAGSVDAILEAIEKFQGSANHAATESKVLREWLDIERRRVERLLFPERP